MIEGRKLYEIKQGDGSILNRLVFYSPLTELSHEKSWYYITVMLKTIADNPEMLNPNGMEFQNISIKHKEGRWVIESQAIKPTTEINL
jgi:hypothetical protein